MRAEQGDEGFVGMEVRFTNLRLETIARDSSSSGDLPKDVKEAFLGIINWFDNAWSEQDLEVLCQVRASPDGAGNHRETPLAQDWVLRYEVADGEINVTEIRCQKGLNE